MVITYHGFLAATSQGRMRLGDAVPWVRSRCKSLIIARRQRKREPFRDHSGLGEGAIPNTWSSHIDIMMNFKQCFCLDVSPQVTPTRAWCKWLLERHRLCGHDRRNLAWLLCLALPHLRPGVGHGSVWAGTIFSVKFRWFWTQSIWWSSRPALPNRYTTWATYEILNFLVATLKKSKMKQVKFKYIIRIKTINTILHFLFPKSFVVNFTQTAHLGLG